MRELHIFSYGGLDGVGGVVAEKSTGSNPAVVEVNMGFGRRKEYCVINSELIGFEGIILLSIGTIERAVLFRGRLFLSKASWLMLSSCNTTRQ